MLVVSSLNTIKLATWTLEAQSLLHLRKDVSRLAWSRPTQFFLPNLLGDNPINLTLLFRFQNLAETRALRNHISNLKTVPRGLRMWTKKRATKQAQIMEVSRAKKKCLKNTTFLSQVKMKKVALSPSNNMVSIATSTLILVHRFKSSTRRMKTIKFQTLRKVMITKFLILTKRPIKGKNNYCSRNSNKTSRLDKNNRKKSLNRRMKKVSEMTILQMPLMRINNN